MVFFFQTWTPELCRKDSDGDGKSNGEELGDPNCEWRENAIPDKNAFSHPGKKMFLVLIL
jgi:dopamine beta-monooxygenase